MSQPVAKKRSKPKVVRTKTFSGCWTCRKRSVKCGEEKPACLRCRRSGAVCGGYGVELIWPDDESGRGCRQVLKPSLSRRRVLGEQALDQALADIEESSGKNDVLVDLFSVFSFKNQGQPACSALGEDRRTQRSTTLGTDEAESSDSDVDLEIIQASSDVNALALLDSHQVSDDTVPRRSFGSAFSLNLDLFPVQTEQEGSLLYYWSWFLCGILTALPRPDNAFRDVITPMALTALSFNGDSAGHSALLNAIYSLTAASRRSLRPGETETYDALSRKYLISSVRHLGQALSTTDFQEQQAILAAIMLLVINSSFSGESSEWRVHLKGGLLWLDNIDLDVWARSQTATTLHQLFFTLASLRSAYGSIAKGLPTPKRMLKNSRHAGAEEDSKVQGNRWHVFSIWGIPDAAMAIIERINHYIYTHTEPSGVELTELELTIYQSDPRHVGMESLSTLCGQMALANAMLFHYGCHIYLGSVLLKRPTIVMQYFVTCGIERVEELMALETGLDVSGMLWPAFIIACETEGEDLRSRVMRYFDRRESMGIANVADAKRIISEVWRRRDEDGSGVHVSWQDVMLDLGIDISLS